MNFLLLSDRTGFTGPYDVYPYGDYKTSDNLLFSVNNEDNRLHKKERVHGVVADSSGKNLEGTRWDVFGRGISGPRTGNRL